MANFSDPGFIIGVVTSAILIGIVILAIPLSILSSVKKEEKENNSKLDTSDETSSVVIKNDFVDSTITQQVKLKKIDGKDYYMRIKQTKRVKRPKHSQETIEVDDE